MTPLTGSTSCYCEAHTQIVLGKASNSRTAAQVLVQRSVTSRLGKSWGHKTPMASPVIIGPLAMLGFPDNGETDEGQAI